MPKEDIFKLAELNSENLEEQFSKIEKEFTGDNRKKDLDKFAGHIQNYWSVSINFRPIYLIRFLKDGKYKNTYELHKSDKKLVKKQLGTLYKPRTTFDAAFKNGIKFKYGALNTGNIGLKDFGDYCAVIKKEIVLTYKNAVFLKQDSLKQNDDGSLYYFNKDGTLNIDELKTDLSTEDKKLELAAVKHSEKLKTVPDTEWPDMLCNKSENDYVEFITTDDIFVKNLSSSSVRYSKEQTAFIFDNILNSYTSSTVETTDEIRKFNEIKELLEKNNIELELI